MIDEYLANVRESVNQQFLNIIKGDSQVSKAMLHTVLAPSKCIRAGIVRAAAELEGALNKESINNLQVAVEAMHSYSLIHDDLPAMDDDDMRRGQASNHIAYGEATAILAGDALHSLVYEIVSNDTHLSDEHKINIIKLLSDACGFNGMILGQQLDLESEGSDTGDINKIHALKTGRLISASVALPITNSKLSMRLKTIGEDIGLAFQIMDDVLEITASSGALGKDSGSDIKNKKLTYVSVYGLESAIKNAEKLIEKSKNNIVDLDDSFNKNSLLEICDFIISRDN
ncbi:MAG: polyprenyl synthetase family protein [Gammaproteobacteria bacterium]